MCHCRSLAIGVVVWTCLCLMGMSSQAATPDQLEFFEKRVRPLLVEHCFECHSGKSRKGGLRLDSQSSMLSGGDSGPAIVPSQPEASLLIEAIQYDPAGYQMPPRGKLPPEAIADLTEWVRQGAIWPATAGVELATADNFPLEERAKYWSFQPLSSVGVPQVTNSEWSRNAIDRFMLSSLEAQQLAPASPAERHAWLRRVTFDVTGLPPAWNQVEEFLADDRPDACERVIDRLLSSPHYGERWGRHWLDLVRFSETGGHEFDYEIPYATPYRDYVVRALNADLPYDQFIREHLAGDLLAEPRRDPATGRNESVIGTAFYWFSQAKHSPVDIRTEECDTVDNQVDVLSKTFLGLTVACSRCHDHKFDAIPQRDYYSLAGLLQSSRRTIVDASDVRVRESIAAELTALDRRELPRVLESALESCQQWVDDLPRRLLSTNPADQEWLNAVREKVRSDRQDPFHFWVHWAGNPDLARAIAGWRALMQREAQAALERKATIESPAFWSPRTQLDPSGEPVSPWFYEDLAFREPPGSEWLLGEMPDRLLTGVRRPGTWARSATVSPKFHGTLRSPTFTITEPYIDYWMRRQGGADRPARQNKVGHVHLIVDGFQIIRNPLYGHLTINVEQSPHARWYRQDVRQFIGSRAYIEIEDFDDGEIVVERIETNQGAIAPEPYNVLLVEQLEAAPPGNPTQLASIYQQAFQAALDRMRDELRGGASATSGPQGAAVAELINSMLSALPAREPTAEDRAYVAARQSLEARLLDPEWTIAITDGTSEDEHLLIRGNPRKPGEPVSREFLAALKPLVRSDPLAPPVGAAGSGRLEFANCVADPANPLTARVMVNRLWQHHFGRGLVPTPDDFGKMGQPPSHPELLDWLAAEFIRSGWSLKHMHRLMLNSATYRQSSRLEQADFEERDPENRWWHRMPVQRLEAEPIRDALLAISGRLDDAMYGASVLPHLTPFMEGRGRPGQSGPLDGNGRRSLYINVRRNFLTPMFLAFDFPTPFTTMGRRTTSNVPAQALTMLNNPLVVQQTQLWADRVCREAPDSKGRIQRLYRDAFSREPTPGELASASSFVGTSDDPQAWRDLAHVLVNTKEFVFIE